MVDGGFNKCSAIRRVVMKDFVPSFPGEKGVGLDSGNEMAGPCIHRLRVMTAIWSSGGCQCPCRADITTEKILPTNQMLFTKCSRK